MKNIGISKNSLEKHHGCLKLSTSVFPLAASNLTSFLSHGGLLNLNPRISPFLLGSSCSCWSYLEITLCNQRCDYSQKVHTLQAVYYINKVIMALKLF